MARLFSVFLFPGRTSHSSSVPELPMPGAVVLLTAVPFFSPACIFLTKI